MGPQCIGHFSDRRRVVPRTRDGHERSDPTKTPSSRGRISRVLHFVGDITSKAGFSAAVAACVGGFLVALAAAGFPASWEAGFATGAAAVTLVMVFVIQHTQSRQQLATQLKLDELIRSSPRPTIFWCTSRRHMRPNFSSVSAARSTTTPRCGTTCTVVAGSHRPDLAATAEQK